MFSRAFLAVAAILATAPALAEPLVQYELDNLGGGLVVNVGDTDLHVEGARLNSRDDCLLAPVWNVTQQGRTERFVRDSKRVADMEKTWAAQTRKFDNWTFSGFLIRPGETFLVQPSASPCAAPDTRIVSLSIYTKDGTIELDLVR